MCIRDSLLDHYALYGEHIGVLSARKHIGWYVRQLPGGDMFRATMNCLADAESQLSAVSAYFETLGASMDRLPLVTAAGVDAAWTPSMETA